MRMEKVKTMENIKVVNLTPHDVVVGGLHYPRTGGVARVTELYGPETTEPFPFPARGRSNYGEVTGLPNPQPGVVYIVSFMVAALVPNRSDVFCPGAEERNEAGQIIGVKFLKRATEV